MIISNIPTGILFDECSTFTTFSAAATMDRKYHRSGKKNSFMTYQVVPSHMFLTQFCIFMSNTSTKGWWSHPHFHRSSCITPDRLQDWKAPDKYTHSKYETHKETSLVGQKQKQEKTSKTSTSCKDETKNARLKVVVSFTIPKDCYSDENSFLHVTVKVQKNPTIKSKNNDSVPKSSYGDQYSI